MAAAVQSSPVGLVVWGPGSQPGPKGRKEGDTEAHWVSGLRSFTMGLSRAML